MSRDAVIDVLIADDHEAVRGLVKQLLNAAPDIRVVADTSERTEAIRLAIELVPSIALVDISMRDHDGVTVSRTIAERCPLVGIIAFTRHTDDAFVKVMFDAGARGYVLKQSASSELLAAIRAVASGASYIDAHLRRAPVVTADVSPTSFDGHPASPREPLGPLEEQVLRLAALMLRPDEIAARTRLPIEDVHRLKTQAMTKTRLTGIIQLLQYARHVGWLPSP